MTFFSYSRAMAAAPLLAAWLLSAFLPRPFIAACRLGREQTGRALGYGAIVIALFAAAGWLLASGVFLPHLIGVIFLMSLFAYALVAVVSLAQAVTLVVVGSLARRVVPEDRPWLSAVTGLCVVAIAGWIPFFGNAVRLVASALGFGALALRFREWRKSAAAALLLFFAVPSRAGAPKPFYAMTEREIASELKRIHRENPTLATRVEAVSERFLGAPYVLGPLGEGKTGDYDRDPLFDLTRVDCTTFVEQVMALSLEPDLDQALNKTLQNIRYKDGNISYETRNHFTELDWVPHNAWAGYLRDITAEIAPDATRIATKNVSKRAWYLHKSTDAIQGFGDQEAEKERRLGQLRELGERFQDEAAALPYVPMAVLPAVMDRIPTGTIANLVREDQPDKPSLVSHQVLLIRKGKDKTLFVRHAAFGKDVQDVPALEYFYRYFNSKWPLLGLNLNAITQPK